MKAERGSSRTIVHYTSAEAPFNGYPRKIVSPPRAGSCCLSEMAPLGTIHWDDDYPYVYRRCDVCGHTVRYFLEDSIRPPGDSALTTFRDSYQML